jgi:hypothetical protein
MALESKCTSQCEKRKRDDIRDVDVKEMVDAVKDYIDVDQPDLRSRTCEKDCTEWYEKDGIKLSGLEPIKKDFPDITTLGEKAIYRGTYKQVLALAGLAKVQQKSAFDLIEESITDINKRISGLHDDVTRFRTQLDVLKKMAVLDE